MLTDEFMRERTASAIAAIARTASYTEKRAKVIETNGSASIDTSGFALPVVAALPDVDFRDTSEGRLHFAIRALRRRKPDLGQVTIDDLKALNEAMEVKKPEPLQPESKASPSPLHEGAVVVLLPASGSPSVMTEHEFTDLLQNETKGSDEPPSLDQEHEPTTDTANNDVPPKPVEHQLSQDNQTSKADHRPETPEQFWAAVSAMAQERRGGQPYVPTITEPKSHRLRNIGLGLAGGVLLTLGGTRINTSETHPEQHVLKSSVLQVTPDTAPPVTNLPIDAQQISSLAPSHAPHDGVRFSGDGTDRNSIQTDSPLLSQVDLYHDRSDGEVLESIPNDLQTQFTLFALESHVNNDTDTKAGKSDIRPATPHRSFSSIVAHDAAIQAQNMPDSQDNHHVSTGSVRYRSESDGNATYKVTAGNEHIVIRGKIPPSPTPPRPAFDFFDVR
jgi:hypothetical protein